MSSLVYVKGVNSHHTAWGQRGVTVLSGPSLKGLELGRWDAKRVNVRPLAMDSNCGNNLTRLLYTAEYHVCIFYVILLVKENRDKESLFHPIRKGML